MKSALRLLDDMTMNWNDRNLNLANIAIVIPCYNAGNRLRKVLERLRGYPGPITVVDDGSTDGSATNLEGAHVIRFPRNGGKGAAMLEGFRDALEKDVEAVVVLDADGQHDSSKLPELVRAFRECHAALVIGERHLTERHVPWASWLGNTLTRRVSAWLLGRYIADTQSGFRLHSRRFLEEVVAEIPPGRYETEMAILVRAVKKGYEVVSVPIPTIYEPGNVSSHFQRVRDSYRVWRTLFREVMR
jgi:glycosyltransferase involved in cell wall biosynthesis